MNISKVTAIAFKLMGSRKTHAMREKGFVYYHGERVGRLAVTVKELLGREADVCNTAALYAAGLFHDIGKGTEPHAHHGALSIRKVLSGHCSAMEISEIAAYVAFHNKRKCGLDLSAGVRIIQDADILDHFGSISIWMKFIYSSKSNENPLRALEFWESNAYKVYVRKQRALLNFQISRSIFDKRIEFLETFIKNFGIEAQGRVASC